ncbi:MAG: DUF362 domain-containing protein [Verrucomicrobiota bacterium]
MLKQFFPWLASVLLAFQAEAGGVALSRDAATGSRVVIASDANATIAFQPQLEKVRALFEEGFAQFSGKTNLTEAWQKLVSTNDVIGIKVYSAPGPTSGTRPSVVAATVESLLKAGISPQKIIIWDKELIDLRLAGFDELTTRYKIGLAASSSAGYDEKTFYENPLIGHLIWGDTEFQKKGNDLGRKSFVTKLLSQEITKVITISPLLNHNTAGTAGNLYSLGLGSVDNTHRFEPASRLAAALPEIYALRSLSDKVVLNITDALIAQYQGEQRSLLHYSIALNEIWFSKDPVALDILAIAELNRQREAAKFPPMKSLMEIYENASLLELGVSDLKSIRIERVP